MPQSNTSALFKGDNTEHWPHVASHTGEHHPWRALHTSPRTDLPHLLQGFTPDIPAVLNTRDESSTAPSKTQHDQPPGKLRVPLWSYSGFILSWSLCHVSQLLSGRLQQKLYLWVFPTKPTKREWMLQDWISKETFYPSWINSCNWIPCSRLSLVREGINSHNQKFT